MKEMMPIFNTNGPIPGLSQKIEFLSDRMVCCPCFVFPLISFLLWVFHKFIRPWLSKIWGKPAEMVKNVEENLVCPMPKKKEMSSQENGDTCCTKSDPSPNSSSAKVECQSNIGERLKAE
ncbi:follicle cell protein 3C [Elysia marginata]|uniref:Follicle cell protein 3C n=1 Tax=Elysia marginata TaxID=1093978 RepID=A0AAV4IBJ2_9GAST|nr:follicle cell protein 3C [Elysia marginata]